MQCAPKTGNKGDCAMFRELEEQGQRSSVRAVVRGVCGERREEEHTDTLWCSLGGMGTLTGVNHERSRSSLFGFASCCSEN